MITNQKIIDEVNRLIVSIYPDYVFYIDKVPKDFVRPSFFIEYVLDDSENENKSTTKESLYLNVIYFGTEDKYGITNSIEKLEVLRKLKLLFRNGYITVDDRAISLKVKGKTLDDEIGIEMSFEYYEQRSDEETIEPLMQEVDLTQN